MKTRFLSISLAIVIVQLATAVSSFAEPYLWPLPFTKELTSIFGDFRARRYHVGIDVRTGGEIGKAVVAPADGYISRVRTSYFGYGKALHLNMNDGNSAVFAHLSAFASDIEEFIREKQIAAENYSQDVEVGPDRFRVRRGDTIAYSGNTGVGAPHLHFEVRTPANVPLNPLTLPGLEVEDRIAPELRKIRLIGFGNEELAAALGWTLEFPLRQASRGSAYSASVVLPCDQGSYWLAVEAVDRMARGGSPKPIYEISAGAGGRELYSLRYDRVPFEESYLIDVQRNFAKSSSGSEEFYNLVPLELPRSISGICEWLGEASGPLEIVARDVAGNAARAEIKISTGERTTKSFHPRPDTLKLARLVDRYGAEYDGIEAALIPNGRKLMFLAAVRGKDIVAIEVHSSAALERGLSPAVLHPLGGRFWLGAIDSLEATGALIDGDSLTVAIATRDGKTRFVNIAVEVARIFADADSPGSVRSRDGVFEIRFPKYSSVFFPLEEQLYFRLDRLGIDRFGVYNPIPTTVPIAKPVTYSYRIGSVLPRGAGLYSVGGGGSAYLGGKFDQTTGWISYEANTVAPITVKIDTLPPTISRLRPGAGGSVSSSKPVIKFKLADDLSGIRDRIDVYVDGRWIIPVYDYETSFVSAMPHFEFSKGKHKLEIKVADKQGNTRHHKSDFSVGTRRKK